MKITKKVLLHKVNNDMQSARWYCVYFKRYNKDKTRYIKGKFVITVDMQDVSEYLDIDIIKESDIKEYLDESIFAFIDNFNAADYEDIGAREYFYNLCNETILRYNG